MSKFLQGRIATARAVAVLAAFLSCGVQVIAAELDLDAFLTIHTDTNEVNSVDFSPDGSLLASGHSRHANGQWEGSVTLWDVAAGTQVSTMRHDGMVYSVAFSPDGARLASTSEDQTVRVWDVASGSELARLSQYVLAVAFSPDGSSLAGAGANRVFLWNASAADFPLLYSPRVEAARGRAGWSVAFSPDGGLVAFGFDAPVISIHRATGGEISTISAHRNRVDDVAFSPDGALLAGVSDGIRIWSVEQPELLLLHTIEAHEGAAGSVAFSPNGSLLASGAPNSTVRLWDISQTGKYRASVTLQASNRVGTLAFSPDGSSVAAGSGGTIELWAVPPPSVIAVSPSHGDTLHGLIPITWRTVPIAAEVIHMDYLLSDASAWKTLAQDTPDDGEYMWDTTSTPDGAGTLRIRATTRDGLSIEEAVVITIDNSNTPGVSIDHVEGESASVTIHYSTTSPSGGELATVAWQFSQDAIDWRDVDLLDIGQNFAQPAGSREITWNTQGGTNNLDHVVDDTAWFRMKVTDGIHTSSWGIAGPFPINNNHPPTVTALPVIGEQTGDILVTYTLDDPGHEVLSVAGHYSLDGGTTWRAATLDGVTDGITSYMNRSVTWKATQDLVSTDQEDIMFRLTPADANEGASHVIAGIHVDTNHPPTVDIANIIATVTGDVEVAYALSDLEADELSLQGAYSLDDGGTWLDATLKGTTEGITPAGYSGSLVWRSRLDLPSIDADAALLFRLTPADNDTGSPDITAPFLLVNTPPPTVEITNIIAEPIEDVVIEYRLASEDGRNLWFELEFSTDGGATWEPAQVTGKTEGISAAQYVGSVVWESATGLPSAVVTALVRLTPGDDQGRGRPTISNEFRIVNMHLHTDEIAVLQAHSFAVSSIAFSPDGSTLATGSHQEAKLWDVAARQEIVALQLNGKHRVAFSPDGTTLAIGSQQLVTLWDVAAQREIARMIGGGSAVDALTFSPDGATLAAVANSNPTLWDVLAREEIAALQGHSSRALSVAFSPDGATLASGALREVTLWDVVKRQKITALRHSEWVFSVAFSPDGATLASGGMDSAVRLWDVEERQEIASLQGHSGWVYSVAFSPDGTILASGGEDSTVKLWDIEARQEIVSLQGHSSSVLAVAFSSDGAILASGSEDNTVRLWSSAAVASNHPPAISAPSATVSTNEGDTVSFTLTATDTDGDRIRFFATGLPENAMLDSNSGEFRFLPDATQEGTYPVRFTVTDGKLGTDSVTVTIQVSNTGLFQMMPATRRVTENETLTLTLTPTSDLPDGIEVSAEGVPRIASFDTEDRMLTFAPDLTGAADSPYDVTVHVTLEDRAVEDHTVTVTVADIPAFLLDPAGAQTVREQETLAIQVNRIASADGVTLSATDMPENATFSPTTGAFRFTPDFTQATDSPYQVTFQASQGGQTASSQAAQITVTNVNRLPNVTVEAPSPSAGDVNVPYTIADLDGDPISLGVEYREGALEAWATAALEQAVANTSDYTGSLIWQSREDIPSTGGTEVQLRVTPSDNTQTGAPATTKTFTLVNLLGDYDDDMDVDFDDLAVFAQAWRDNDSDWDIGPTTGTPPDLVPAFDDVIEFEDLMTFVVMWNWSSQNAPLAAPAVVSNSDAHSVLTHKATVDRSDWRRQRIGFALNEPSGTLAAKIMLQYDPQALRVSVGESTDATRGRVFLDRHNEESGILDIQAAWLTKGLLADALASIQVESLRQTDTELQVTFDIRDRFNRSQGGQDVFRMRFEPPPANTALLQNYPNPFNPETWIPFELAEDANVVVTIYDIEGSLIRTLRLGEKTVGRYRGRDRAAYWNGVNEQGESVASGVYVYEFRAGDFREAHRMVIRK